MDNYTLSINNKEVFEFYKTHNLDFEQTNILFLDIFKKLISNIDSSFNSNLASKLLENITLLTSKVDSINNNVSSLLANKFSEYRKEYINDLKLILTSNNVEHISPLIK